MSDFDLDELIEKVRSTTGPDPKEIAVEVKRLIPESEYSSVVDRLLPDYVRKHRLRLSRAIDDPEQHGPATSRTARKPNRSAKVALLQEHARFLRLEVNVGRNQEKYMKDCTYEDLRFAAEIRRKHAASNEHAAETLEKLAELVREHNVATVAKLPAEILSKFLADRRVAA